MRIVLLDKNKRPLSITDRPARKSETLVVATFKIPRDTRQRTAAFLGVEGQFFPLDKTREIRGGDVIRIEIKIDP